MKTKRKKKLYARKFFAADSAVGGGPVPKAPVTWPLGRWMTGTPSFPFLNGCQVTVIRLQDGTTAPLSELIVIPDRGNQRTYDPLLALFELS
jgi:hypothetical protein